MPTNHRFIRLDTLQPVTPSRLWWGADSKAVKVRRSALTLLESSGRVPFMEVSANWAVRVVPESPLDQRAARLAYLIARDGAVCFYCTRELDPRTEGTKPNGCTIEHVVALSAGGPDHASNLALSCPSCNAAAGHLSAVEKFRYALKMRGKG